MKTQEKMIILDIVKMTEKSKTIYTVIIKQLKRAYIPLVSESAYILDNLICQVKGYQYSAKNIEI